MQAFAGTANSPTRIPITLKTKGLTARRGLRRFTNQRLETFLGRFKRRIRRVDVWLEDVNGPRGGIDTRCRIDLRLHPRGRLSVDAQAVDEYGAITKAANRTRSQLDRRYKRSRTRRRAWLDRKHSRKRAALFPEIQHTGIHMNSLEITRKLVSIGSTIEIRDLHSNDVERYTLTHPRDADIARNRISSLTPMGKAVFGRSVGDTVKVNAPGGQFRVRIEAIDHFADHLARAG
jgi:transcription elongation GreA/GreB family factor